MSELICKKCKGKHKTKNGFVRGKQRYICKRCGISFVESDTRGKVPLSLKKAGPKAVHQRAFPESNCPLA